MDWKNNKVTIISNVVQQVCSIVIFLTIPNILHIDGYAKVVFVSTLLSFMTFADLGLSFVYSRKMPAIYVSSNMQEAKRWNETVFTFRIAMAFLFGFVIGLIYYVKYQEPLNTVLLFMMPVMTVIPSFFIAQHTALSNFATYRRINSFQAVARLVTIGGVIFLGIEGWFVSQLLASLLAVVIVLKAGGLPTKISIDSRLLKEHFIEGVLLGLITTLWVQLLGSGKVFASFMYADAQISQYGLMNTGYQIIAALIVAAFIPQTVKVYGMIETNLQAALEYVFRTILYAIPIVVGLTIVSREITPYVLMYFFPKYQVDPLILDSLIFSLPFYPIIVTLGAILVAKKKSPAYLLLIAISLVLNWMLIMLLNPDYGFRSAAIAQIITLLLYSIFLVALTFYYFNEEVKSKSWKFIKIYGSLALFIFSYFFVRYELISIWLI